MRATEPYQVGRYRVLLSNGYQTTLIFHGYGTGIRSGWYPYTFAEITALEFIGPLKGTNDGDRKTD